MNEIGRAAAPWHVWAVGIISLLWNAMGAFDYTMTHLSGDEYMRQMDLSDQAVAWVGDIPAWATAGWAIGVWGGVLGSVLLLARSRFAVHAFALSLVGVLLMTLYALPNPMPGVTPGMQTFDWVIKIVAVLLLWYAWTMRRRGVLR